MKTKLFMWLTIVITTVLAVSAAIDRYDRLVTLEDATGTAWSQVEDAYQRRADIVSSLVHTMKTTPAIEREAFAEVIATQMRAQMLGTSVPDALRDPAIFAAHQSAQDELSSALSRLIVALDEHRELDAIPALRALTAQLERAEGRIGAERVRFNELAGAFNAERRRSATAMVAALFGGRFDERPYFKARTGTENLPQVTLR